MKTPEAINMNAENAFVLREAAKAHDMGYCDHLAHGGKGDPAEERWIEALNAGAEALAKIQQLERERDALLLYAKDEERCGSCKYANLSLAAKDILRCPRNKLLCGICDRDCPCAGCDNYSKWDFDWDLAEDAVERFGRKVEE